jgi:hypothetical protein
VLSYWCAVYVLDSIAIFDPRLDSGLAAITSAGVVGAGIVFVAAKFIVPFKGTLRYLLLGLLAGVIGGSAFHALENSPGPYYGASFIAWHCIVCAGLHFGTRQSGESVHA